MWSQIDPPAPAFVHSRGFVRPAPGVGIASDVAWRRMFARRARRRLATVLVALLVALAVLPSVVPYDHLVAGHALDGHDALHASHCHASPGTCADAPVTSGPGQLLLTGPLLTVPPMLILLLAPSAPPLRGLVVRPAPRPPARLPAPRS